MCHPCESNYEDFGKQMPTSYTNEISKQDQQQKKAKDNKTEWNIQGCMRMVMRRKNNEHGGGC